MYSSNAKKECASDAIAQLTQQASPEKAAAMQRFFKTGKGQYAEGDKFLGLTTPDIRKVVKVSSGLPLPELRTMLFNEFHEVRSCALAIMVGQYAKENEELREELLALYSAAAPTQINNWDLVDISAPGIVGKYELEHHSGVIDRFSQSAVLWEQRISVVSTLTLIRHGEFDLTLKLCKKFLTHKHDLMHKACGWMLREIGKRDRSILTAFLNEHRLAMPRTMLRYAIEHYPEEQRKEFMNKSPSTGVKRTIQG